MSLNKSPDPPASPCAVAFVDGQNLFHCAKEAFGYNAPNFDVKKLATEVCASLGWKLTQVRFYTGVPPKDRSPVWHDYWAKKTTRMSRVGVHVFTKPLRYTAELLEDGTYKYIPREKGIDVRIAIDVLSMAIEKQFDAALIFSQDQDLSEVAVEMRKIARKQDRWIKVASAYPVSSQTENTRGINGTDWIKLNKETYDKCLDGSP
jgi:uncharacterized LabA/DUF88 family protein